MIPLLHIQEEMQNVFHKDTKSSYASSDANTHLWEGITSGTESSVVSVVIHGHFIPDFVHEGVRAGHLKIEGTG